MARDIAIDPAFAEALVGATEAAPGPRATADAILAAAEQLFIEKGYHGTRVSEVARMADVSIGSIYVHYESKEGLYGALVARALEMEERFVDAVLDDPDTPDLEKVIALGESYLQFFRESPAYFRMLMVPLEDIPQEAIDNPVTRQVAERGARQVGKLAEAIESCIEQGIMRPSINPQNAANFWWAAWNGIISLTMRSDQLALTIEEMERVVIEGRLMIAEGMASQILRDENGQLQAAFRERLEQLNAEVVPAATAAE